MSTILVRLSTEHRLRVNALEDTCDPTKLDPKNKSKYIYAMRLVQSVWTEEEKCVLCFRGNPHVIFQFFSVLSK